jgi:protein-L-isoaspartate(D-aspartate) O-methyltransferase
VIRRGENRGGGEEPPARDSGAAEVARAPGGAGDGSAARGALHFGAARRKMADGLREKGITDPRLLEALATVPRHLFGPKELEAKAYDDVALPIGFGQTVSAPITVARMTQALEIAPDEKALEIGTGSGYQAAILAALAGPVFTVERIAELSEAAQATLRSLAIERVTLLVGDGSLGWRELAPFHVILVAAASPKIPEPLVDQLAEGGRLVVPVGDAEGRQELVLVRRERGRFATVRLGECLFVPLIGRAGWRIPA